jgi:hypothetical protein
MSRPSPLVAECYSARGCPCQSIVAAGVAPGDEGGVIPLLIGLALAAAPAARESIGQFGRWGAFRDHAPRRCWAVAMPRGRAPGRLIATADGRIEIEPHPASLTARIDGVPVTVATRLSGRDARRLIGAMRTGEALRLTIRGRGGRLDYPLAGFASAFDAARVACLR